MVNRITNHIISHNRASSLDEKDVVLGFYWSIIWRTSKLEIKNNLDSKMYDDEDLKNIINSLMQTLQWA